MTVFDHFEALRVAKSGHLIYSMLFMYHAFSAVESPPNHRAVT